MSCLITMSQKELHRLELIQRIRGRSLTVVEAAAAELTLGGGFALVAADLNRPARFFRPVISTKCSYRLKSKTFASRSFRHIALDG
ncbi:hypothetical protein ACL2DZ_00500 (plasmid) [Sinorhizobium meliloti]